MADSMKVDLAVIGAGSGGLSVAAGAVQMGASVALFERAKMGGDCLNYGCVPSKSLLAAAHVAQAARAGGAFGVDSHEPPVRFRRVHDHVHEVIAGIAPHDSVERFTGLGVEVVTAAARFVGPRELEADGRRFGARRVVVATGSTAAIPALEGIDSVPYLTNETIFELTELPAHLIVVGGGPIGMEMAQAHRRLGSAVTVIQRGQILPKDDAEAAEVVRRRVLEEGVTLLEGAEPQRVSRTADGVEVTVNGAGGLTTLAGSHLLIAAGRRPNLDGLELEAAGIAYTHRGITVDARLRTSNKRVYAIGDVAGGYQFTHVAGYHAGIVIRNALFLLPAKANHESVPWVTYTDPELAHVGVHEAQARADGEEVKVVRFPFAENDRARAERATEGFIKVVLGRRGKVRGATIVGPHAGELILPWVLALQQGMKIGKLAGVIAPYPTLSEVSKRVAGSHFTEALFSERTQRIVRLLQRVGG